VTPVTTRCEQLLADKFETSSDVIKPSQIILRSEPK
jgi:hypothetical protein